MSRKQHKHRIILLTGQQWLGVTLLLILIIGSLIAVKHYQLPMPTATTWTNDSTQSRFSSYQNQQDSIRRATYKPKYQRDTITLRLREFDPNTVDSITLRQLGFKPWQAHNMLKYRNRGGRYRKAEDLLKLYGMTDSMYLSLAPYIRIAADSTHNDTTTTHFTHSDTTRLDTLARTHNIKKDTIISLHSADTTLLKMIPGIGTYRAQQIVRYRQQLGGFTHIEQIMEAPGMQHMSDSILRHFRLDSLDIRHMHINTITVKQLAQHPYLRFEQAKAIYELRRHHVRIDSIQQLRQLDCLDDTTIEKIAPYLNFD